MRAGKETAVFVLHGCQRERVVNGVSHSLHQSDWWSSWKRGASGWTEKWSCMLLYQSLSLHCLTFSNSIFTLAYIFMHEL